MKTSDFIDPYTRTALVEDSDGNLCSKEQPCVVLYRRHEGCYDFVKGDTTTGLERAHYDREYALAQFTESTSEDVRREWFHEMTPWRLTLLESLGDLKGKRVLLVGNGETSRELYFAMLGADIVLTDLSLQGVLHIKKQFETSDIGTKMLGSVEFHAVDALHLPFPDETFDIIYGAAFVHHLGDETQFFSEVWRCLKFGGVCRFLDQADSSAWRTLSRTLLWPLKKFSYWWDPRSPGDIEADKRVGCTREGLQRIMDEHRFRNMLFKSEWFFFRIVSRHYGKLVHYRPGAMASARRPLLFFKWLDESIATTSFMKSNALMLTWGFTK